MWTVQVPILKVGITRNTENSMIDEGDFEAAI